MSNYQKIYNFVGLLVCLLALKLSLKLLTVNSAFLSSQLNLKICFCQTFFLFELFNILVGKSNSRFLISLLQLSSRLFISWVVVYYCQVLSNYYVTIMYFAWFVADSVRYFFYLFKQNKLVVKLRYTLFIVLYPLGTSVELYGVYRLSVAREEYKWLLMVVGIAYLPGFVMLYSHLLKLRRKRLFTVKINKNNKID